ncbi:MAG TPA: glycosyltransferase 87 family protein [Acidimicrobiia bacterium]|nr:glycosyltransferase 87 family protein [Acidimicrobiia bacterium]
MDTGAEIAHAPATAARRPGAAAGLVLVAVVVFGFAVNTAVRMPCYDVCGSDIARLYQDRGIDRAHAPYFSRDLEYPPLIGLVMYAAVLPFDHGLRNPFLVNALVLTALAAVATWVLWRRNGRRAWRWALAPPLLLEGLTNWDLLSVATATIGLVVWENGYAFSAGVLLGIGAAAKLFPALYVPILAATSFGRRRRNQGASVIAGAIIGLGVFAVPVYTIAPHALRYLVEFHGDRGPDRGSLWYFVVRGPSLHPWLGTDAVRHLVTVVPAALLVAALGALTVKALRGRISPFAACALVTIACLLVSKIYSPQYDLWIVPFFVLLPVPRKLVVHFYVASFLVWGMTATDDHAIHRPASGYLLGLAVLYRFVVLVFVAITILRDERAPAAATPVIVLPAYDESAQSSLTQTAR